MRERGAENEMTAEEMTLLSKAVEKLVSGVRVSLDRELPRTEMLRLRDILTDHPGEVAVEFEVQLDDELVRIAPAGAVSCRRDAGALRRDRGDRRRRTGFNASDSERR